MYCNTYVFVWYGMHVFINVEIIKEMILLIIYMCIILPHLRKRKIMIRIIEKFLFSNTNK